MSARAYAVMPHGDSARAYAVMPQATTGRKSSSSKIRHVIAIFIYAIILLLLLIALSHRRRKAIRVSFACAIPQRI